MPSWRFFSGVRFVLFCFVFRLHVFVKAAALRSIVLRYAGVPIATRVSFFLSFFFFTFYLEMMMSLYFFLYHFHFLFVWRARRTFFPSGWCFFYLVTTGWNSINQSIICCVVVFFALTDRASTISSNIRGCQSGTWSQGDTKVNGSHHGDNPLLRPTGIQIATKSYTTLQAMAPANINTVHQTSLLHIESSLDRLGLLSPTHDQRS